MVQEDGGDPGEAQFQKPLVHGVPLLLRVLVNARGQGRNIIRNLQFYIVCYKEFFHHLAPIIIE
jgi:hypothetical protein